MRVFWFMIAVVLVGGGILLAVTRDSTTADDGDAPASTETAASEPLDDSALIDPGMTWSVTLIAEGPSVAPTPGSSRIERIFDFEVTAAPSQRGGDWTISAHERDAVGPAADGFDLFYRTVGSGDSEALELTGAAASGRDRVDAASARAVVGVDFPLQDRIESPPADDTVRIEGQVQGQTPPPVPVPEG